MQRLEFSGAVRSIYASLGFKGLKSDKNNGYLHEDQYTFLIITRSFLVRMRNVSDKSCRVNQNTHFMFSNVSTKIVPFGR